MIPPLAAAYALLLVSLRPRPATDEMLTILPERCRFMTGATVWQKRKVASRLKAIRRRHSSSVSSSTVAAGRGMMVLPPTALTRMSMRLCARTTLSTTALT